MAGEAEATREAGEFAQVLKQTFKPRTEREAAEIEGSVKVLVEQALADASVVKTDTLDTVGEFTWDGDLSAQTATAHPKIDPRDGSLVFFGYMAKGEATRDIAYYEADARGRIVHEAWFEAPYSSMVHDWAVTETWTPTMTDQRRNALLASWRKAISRSFNKPQVLGS